MDQKCNSGGEVKLHEKRANIMEDKVIGIDFGSILIFNNSQSIRDLGLNFVWIERTRNLLFNASNDAPNRVF